MAMSHRWTPQLSNGDAGETSLALDGPINVQLPGGWGLRHLVQATGPRVIEIYDTSRDMVGFVASTKRPIASIAAAWRGFSADRSGERHWWALAIGHAHRDTEPQVSFASLSSRGHVRRMTVIPTVTDGLWVAMATGRQGTVRLRQGPLQRTCRVAPTFHGRR
jgi:hypothetical protein